MKFSHSIQFNSVPDWADHYLAYSNLKKLIYQIERDIISSSIAGQNDTETPILESEDSPLLVNKSRANAIFVPALDKELTKINTFYINKEKELLDEVNSLISDYAVFENLEDNVSIRSSALAMSRSSYQSGDGSHSRKKSSQVRRTRSVSDTAVSFMSSDEDEAETHDLHPTGGSRLSADIDADNRLSYLWSPSLLEEQRIRLKKRTIELFVWLSELKSFVSLNNTGFSKILKKYDKITNSSINLKSTYLNEVVGESYPFRQSTRQKIEQQISKVQEIYANLCTNADMDLAMRELKTHLREFIVWERNTIWRDIIGLERKSHAVGIKEPVTVNGSHSVGEGFTTPFGRVNVPYTFWKNAFLMSLFVGVFLFLLNVPLFDKVEENNCFALLVFASLLWATEVIPLFVTSLLVPLLVVCLQVLREKDTRLTAHDATKAIFQAMFSPVIMLLLGGFAIAGALSKYHIAKMMATYVLSKAGTKPSFVLLANMFVATFASMWISNVAAPVLCLSIIQPILRNLPPNNSFGRCLILGIALASNVGGMASPISSPQNIIAIENMNPSPTWIQWFFVAIPLCILIDILIWLLLIWNYEQKKSSLMIHPIRTSKDPWTGTQIFVIIVTVATIFLWCIEKRLEYFFGDMGIIAIVPLVLFFGTGILTKEDFNNFLWTVIILAMGGIALGRAVHSSGLLHTIAKRIQEEIGDLHPWHVLVIFSFLVLIVATFISHTVGALIILPIVARVGERLSDSHPNLLVMGSAFMCSAAMGLPVSGFPNMNAIMMEDEMGVRYLSTIDFIKSGIPGSILALLSVVTVGYVLMSFVGF
ncbi:SPX domain-containing protein [Glomus cerebriforme]|uniref:SPX domain-containing protein n=1 Tax=Glomus cerebriforme TaxID=658196 RepID=A0A397SHI5_9GLOM|nr:SPX domain-containing protein [Glomus cerebriforme]